MHMHAHSSTIHNSQKVETVQMSISSWMDKQIVLCTYNGILSSHKNHEVLIYATWTNLENINAKTKKPDTKAYYHSILYDSLYMKYSAQIDPWRQNTDGWLPRGGGGEEE